MSKDWAMEDATFARAMEVVARVRKTICVAS